jgi:hypothetical protein
MQMGFCHSPIVNVLQFFTAPSEGTAPYTIASEKVAMARLDRYFLPDQPLHVIQRGNNRAAAFFCDDDDTRYRGWLADAAAE